MIQYEIADVHAKRQKTLKQNWKLIFDDIFLNYFLKSDFLRKNSIEVDKSRRHSIGQSIKCSQRQVKPFMFT